MPSEGPILTIGMPVYNEARHVGEAVESLLAQTHGDFVLHISDNASTDESSEICQRLADRDSRIKYERQKVNLGSGRNWQHLLDSAETELFMWAGAHDRWAPTLIERLVPALLSDGVILAYGRTQALDADGALGAIWEDDHTNTSVTDPSERFLGIVQRLGICNMLHGIWRTETLRMSSLARASFAIDVLLIAELAFEGCYKQVPEVLFNRRTVRSQETTRQRVARALSIVTGKEISEVPGWLNANVTFLRDHWEILENQRPELSRARELKLKALITPIILRRHIMNPLVREEVLPMLPSPLYNGLRAIWRQRPGAG